MKKQKILFLALGIFILTGSASAIDLNDSESLDYWSDDTLDFRVDTDGTIQAQNKLNMNSNNISNYWSNTCQDGKVVDQIFDNGTLSCVDPSEDVEVENLSETLEAGNVANQSIDMDGNNITNIGDIKFGDAIKIAADSGSVSSTVNSKSIAIGDNSEAGGYVVTDPTPGVAIGSAAYANEGRAVAIGDSAQAQSLSALAVGGYSEATNEITKANYLYSTAIGAGAQATANYAVAIGQGANAPNQYEATFGNLQGQELDVNVTGNLTVHGQNLDLKNGNISNYFGDACETDKVADGVYDNGTLNCVNTDGFGTDNQNLQYNGDSLPTSESVSQEIGIENGDNISFNDAYEPDNQTLSEVLVQGDTANRSIDMGENGLLNISSANFSDAIQIGSVKTDSEDDIVIGKGAAANEFTGTNQLAVGDSAEVNTDYAIALGAGAKSTNTRGVAVGGQADAGGSYSTALGESASSSAGSSIAVGSSADANGESSISIGTSSRAEYRGTTLGYEAGSSSSGNYAVILGRDAEATGKGAIAIGSDTANSDNGAEATADGAVAIGDQSQAPNSYEATFGNLNSEELDVNVTGNATIHGSGGLDMKSNEVKNIGNLTGSDIVNTDNLATEAVTNTEIANNVVNRTQLDGSSCSKNDLLRSDNSNWNCVSQDNVGTDDQDLSEVLVEGNEANQSINMTGNSIVDVGQDNITLGDGSGDIDMNDNRLYNVDQAQFEAMGVADSLNTVQNNINVDSHSMYVQDNISVGGDIVGTGGSDLAENVNTEENQSIEPATVTTISGNEKIEPSSEEYDTGVAGVVSTNPGVKLAEKKNGVPLALSGIVPVKVTTTNGDISAGDLLTSSNRTGYAMKCRDSLKCHGSIIGKAMESADKTGKVEMLVTLG